MTRLQLKISAVALALLLAAAGCGTDTGSTQQLTTITSAGATSIAPAAKEVAERNNSLIRFVHAVPAMAAGDFFVDDAKAFTNTAYKTVTPYAEHSAARHTFRLRVAGQDAAQPLAEESESLGKGAHYTAVAVPVAGTAIISRTEGTDLLFIADEIAAPAEGKAKLRVVHAVPDLGELDVYLAGRAEAVLSGVDFGTASKYAEIDPFAGAVDVKRGGENVTTLNIPQLNLSAGKIYTVFVVGRTKGAANLEAVSIEDQLGTPAKSER